jgi:hypothetical protein
MHIGFARVIPLVKLKIWTITDQQYLFYLHFRSYGKEQIISNNMFFLTRNRILNPYRTGVVFGRGFPL